MARRQIVSRRIWFFILMAFLLVSVVFGETETSVQVQFQADTNWRPVHWEPMNIQKGSALDFSVFVDNLLYKGEITKKNVDNF